MYYVYILESVNSPTELYAGSTSDLKSRYKAHNDGLSKHTKKFRPWNLIWYCAFPNKEQAEEFEKYLKTSSGTALRNKRLIQKRNSSKK